MKGQQQYKRDKRSPIPKNEGVSKVMSSIKGKGTKLETIFRNALYKEGLRGYRINFAKLPGKPDIALTKLKILIFVHGCFWHGCNVCGRRIPKHNSQYWSNKLDKNIERDRIRRIELEKMGYEVIEIWEHEIQKEKELTVQRVLKKIDRIKQFRRETGG